MKTILLSLMLFSTLIGQSDVVVHITQGDSLFRYFDNAGALEAYLAALNIDSLNYEANWKAARAFVDIGETLEGDPRAQHYSDGEFHARRATRIDSTGSKGHLFLSIALGRVALDASAKKRIQLSKEIKAEVDLAIQYNPEDDSAYHVLGRWNRKLSNLTWIEKAFANMFLGGVPEEASNQNAIKSFKRAIELHPEHINHHLELGITYEMMGWNQLARVEFQKCLSLPKSDSDDDRYKKDAQERLDDL
jgi:tetratricopeptide (TPR) repeat protein